MVVVARALAVHPADEPDVEVGVPVQLLIEARVDVVAHVRSPEMLGRDELGGEVGHPGPIEVRVGANALAQPDRKLRHVSESAHVSSRSGVSVWSTCVTASPKPRTASSVGCGSTTGVSLP